MEKKDEPQSSGEETARQIESVRTILMSLSDGLNIVVSAVQQLSLNFNAMEHLLSDKLKIDKKIIDDELSEIKKKLVDELVEQVKDNSQVRKAAEEIKRNAEQAEKEKKAPMGGMFDTDVHSA